MLDRITHWIDGQDFSGPVGRSAEVRNPATGTATALVDLADAEVVDGAVSAAVKAGEIWRRQSLARRGQVLFKFRELLNDRKSELAALITAENGKVFDDAVGEVTRGLEVVEYACGIPIILKGEFSEGVSSDIDVYSIRQPLGVVAIISPFNFPAMVPMWFFPIAIACGNAVIMKPSEKVPSAAVWLARLWAEAGLPAGVFNVVHGDKSTVDALIEHKSIDSVSFVGSTPVAKYVYEKAAQNGKRVQALGGAKNHMVVLADADLTLAADSAVNAGFGSAGERCMAISVLVVIDSVADNLIELIAERMSRLRVGDGNRSSDMGPLISAVHRDRVRAYVDSGVRDGASLVIDGRVVHPIDGAEDGFWLRPTLFDRVTVDMQIYTDEIFGPVLSVLRVATFDEALEVVNQSPFGNGAAIFTRNGSAGRRFQYEVQVGMVGINVPIPVPVAFYSFGGWKNSLFGDAHAHGSDGVKFFTRGKVVTSRWPQPSAAALDLAFPQQD